MANTIEITVKANDQASGALKNIANEAKGLGAILKTELMGGIANLAGRAFDGITRSIGGAVDEVAVYTQSIKDLSNLTGATMEESSRLANVADDLKIGFGDLQTALEAATRKGFDPSTESLAKLSDQYLKLQPGLQRSQFLMDTFGRSGMALAEIMKLGGAAIRDKASAVEDSLVLDDQAKANAEDWRMALDDLDDSMLGVKVQLAQSLLPMMTDFAVILKETVVPAVKFLTDAFNSMPDGAKQATIGFGAITLGVMGLAGPVLNIVKLMTELSILFGGAGAAGAAGAGGGAFAGGTAAITALGTALTTIVLPIMAIAAGLKFIADNAEAAWDSMLMLGAISGNKVFGTWSDQQVLALDADIKARQARRSGNLGATSLEGLLGFGAGAGNGVIVNINSPVNTANRDEIQNILAPIIQAEIRRARQ